MIDFLEQIRPLLSILALSLARLVACFAILPFLGGKLLPGYVRNSILITLMAIVYPIVAATAPTEPFALRTMVLLLFKEIFLGLLIGFLVGIVFWAAEISGYLIDTQRGASMASVLDPLYGHSTSPLGTVLLQLVTVLFFASGGFLIMLEGLFESYQFWPVFQFFPQMKAEGPLFFLGGIDKLMKSALLLASPVLMALFLSDFCLALASRFVPQLNVFNLAMPIKSGVAGFMLIIYLSIVVYFFKRDVSGIERLINTLRGILE